MQGCLFLNKRIFEKTAPERVNINSDRIINFLNRLEKDELDMHSSPRAILRSGNLICETYYAPFTRETLPQDVPSITKSLVSVAAVNIGGRGESQPDRPQSPAIFPNMNRKRVSIRV